MRTILLACAIAAPFVLSQQPQPQPPRRPVQIIVQQKPQPKDPTAIEPGGAIANQIDVLVREAVAKEKLRMEAEHRAEIAAIENYIRDRTREAHAGMYIALDSYLHEIGKNPFPQIDLLREQNRRLADNQP